MRSNPQPSAALSPSTRRRGRVRETRAASGFPVFDIANVAIDRDATVPGLPLLLEVPEVAHLLGLGRTKAYQLIAREEIPVVRIGRCVRVPLDELRAWIAARVVEPVELPHSS